MWPKLKKLLVQGLELVVYFVSVEGMVLKGRSLLNSQLYGDRHSSDFYKS